MPAATTVTAATRVGIMNEWSSTRLPIVVVPVRSNSAVAI
jgi:hypothetical protein